MGLIKLNLYSTVAHKCHAKIVIFFIVLATFLATFLASSNHLLSTLSWERLSLRGKKQKALMMYKTMNDLAPEYLQSLFSQRHSAYNLRNSEGRLTLSKPSTNYLKRSLSYSGAMLWNNLPKNLKKCCIR